MKEKILITHNLFREGFEELSDVFDLVFPSGNVVSEEELEEYLPKIYGLLPTYGFKVTKDIIDRCANLKIIANYGAGYDNIDVGYAISNGIVVTNNPQPVTRPTAEFTFALMLALARKILLTDRQIREGDLQWGLMNNLGTTLCGKTLGIIGLGKIGEQVARYAAVAGMNIIYHNRSRLEGMKEKELGALYFPFEDLLRKSDVITVHVPLSDSTRHIISHTEFGIMKPSAMIINASRGGIIDEKALIEVLSQNKIAGAALDVYEKEPDIEQQLLKLDNVILAPHNGTGTIEARIDMNRCAAANILKFHEGNPEIDRVS